MGATLGHFYNYRFDLDARLAAEEGTEVVSLVDETTTTRTFIRDVMLPKSAAVLASRSLFVDIEITCEAQNPFACSEWDRIGSVHLCADGMPCTDRLELARWITPYWRPGRQRYLIDATPLLPLLGLGGERRTFFVELGPDWERPTEWVAQVSLRFGQSTSSDLGVTTAAMLAFRGGAFDASYNMRAPFTFTAPPEMPGPGRFTRVSLITILSGHGQTMGDNCAEWCDHRHSFTVNGMPGPTIAFEGEIGSDRGCAARATEGVIPGQWGNWAQARAYWCPGLPVAARRDDITSLIDFGAENSIALTGMLGMSAPRGGDIALSTYVVFEDFIEHAP
jgi:hypothetical protein